MVLRDGRSGLQVIERDECLRLLAEHTVGRLAVVDGFRPAVFPVNYVLSGDEIIFRSDAGSKLEGALRGEVAFEIDEIDEAAETGWSVIVAGRAEEVDRYSSSAVRELLDLSVRPWAGGEKAHLVRIVPTRISGRRLDHAGGSTRGASPAGDLPDGGDPVALVDQLAAAHSGLERELDDLHRLAQRVRAADGGDDPASIAVERLVGELRAKLERHVDMEDRTLFPAIRDLATGGSATTNTGAMRSCINVMLSDHDHAVGQLGHLREVTDGFVAPDGASEDHRSLYHRLETIESDTLRHVDIVDNVLFPRVLELLDVTE